MTDGPRKLADGVRKVPVGLGKVSDSLGKDAFGISKVSRKHHLKSLVLGGTQKLLEDKWSQTDQIIQDGYGVCSLGLPQTKAFPLPQD